MLVPRKRIAVSMWSIAVVASLSFADSATLPVSNEPVDLRIVVDVSAPMAGSDATGVRQRALERLISQLPDGTRAGLWFYSRHVEQMVPFGTVDAMWRQLAIIHSRNMGTGGEHSELGNALSAATWDGTGQRPHHSHIVLISNGRFVSDGSGNGITGRQSLLNDWGTQLRKQRFVVHALDPHPPEREPESAADPLLLKQLASLGGGVYRKIVSPTEVNLFVQDVLALTATPQQLAIDELGRFQVPPQTQEISLFYHAVAQDSPTLTRPDGTMLSRLSYLEQGRWVLGATFEAVTLRDPQPGWWRATPGDLSSVSVFDDLQVQVDGLINPVVPTLESHALVYLLDDGAVIENERFLDLLSVRAWLRQDEASAELPVERVGNAFKCYFVNLHDGLNHLDVEIAAPTFTRKVTRPFEVHNPLRVEFRAGSDGVSGWVAFNHPEVDYATVSVSAKVRKPPGAVRLIPGSQLPGGLFEVALPAQEGVVETQFIVKGNYLNNKGFYMNTKNVSVDLPMAAGAREVFRFDVAGQLLDAAATRRIEGDATLVTGEAGASSSATGSDAGTSSVLDAGKTAVATPVDSVPTTEAEGGLPALPLWFVVLLSFVNLGIGAAIWWLLKPQSLDFELLDSRTDEALPEVA